MQSVPSPVTCTVDDDGAYSGLEVPTHITIKAAEYAGTCAQFAIPLTDGNKPVRFVVNDVCSPPRVRVPAGVSELRELRARNCKRQNKIQILSG